MELFALEYFLNPNKRVFWLYLLSSLLLALAYMFFNPKQWRLQKSKALWMHPSAVLDYYYFFIAYAIKIVLIFPVVISAKEVAFFVQDFLTENFGYVHIRGFSKLEIMALFSLTLFLVSDFTRYWLHRFLHTIPFLWEFHKVHHSAKVLTPITFYRVHPVENVLFGFRYALSIGSVSGVFIFLFQAKLAMLDVLGVNLFVFAFSLLGSNLRHSHIPLAYPKVLEAWLLSPKQHQIHHSTKHFDKNFGGYFALWDRVFGSLCYSKEVKQMKFGLRAEQMGEYNSLKKVLLTPFLMLCKRYNILKG